VDSEVSRVVVDSFTVDVEESVVTT